MTIELRQGARWALVAPTSMGVRLTPEDRQPVHVATRFTMHATSAESNVASIPAHLGLPVKLITAFVEGSPVAAVIRRDLAARGIAVDGPELPQGDAWGLRHQFNIADSGAGLRAPRVHNDRAGEVGRELTADLVDVDRIFGDEGVQVLHLSGLIASLSPGTSRLCLDLARAARAHGTTVSFDLNYRASFWKGRTAELREVFTEIAQACDVLIGNEEDFQLALGVPGPPEGGGDLAGELEQFTAMIGRVRAAFPGARVVATTLRQVVSAEEHLWGGILDADGELHVAEPRPIRVVDRIGGGDGFVGGLLYGLLRGWEPERWLQFGWATGALAATMTTDYAAPADEAQVWSIWQGNARVQR